LITKAEVAETTEAFTEIVKSAAVYRQALATVAEAAAGFGAALESGAKCKGSGAAGEGLLSASGLFYLVANHEQILAHSVKKNFEDPITGQINQFRLQNMKNEEQFKINIKDKIKDLKRQEYENAKLSKLKTRNLVIYRSKLQELTSQIDEIDKLKHDYYQHSYDLVQDTSNNIVTQLGTIIRAQVEIYEGIARKGWSGGGLDDLLARCPDPFAQDEEDNIQQEEVEEPKDTDHVNDSQIITTASNGISINRDSSLALSTISPTISNIQTESVQMASTPVSKSTLIDQLHQQSDGIKAGDDSEAEDISENNSSSKSESVKEDEENNVDLLEHVANLTLDEDDNSFSLPVPGSSSRGTKSPEKYTDDHKEANDTPGTSLKRHILGDEHNLWLEES
jgi:hypothetical protein